MSASVHACDQTHARNHAQTQTVHVTHLKEGEKIQDTGTNEDGRSKSETKRGMISVCPARP